MQAPFVITKCVCKCICVLTVGCHISSLRLFLSAKYLFSPFVSVILYRCVPAHIYNPQLYGVSKVVLNNAGNLRLTTEQTQWGLSAQDILLCIVLCCTLLSSQYIRLYTVISRLYGTKHAQWCGFIKEHMNMNRTVNKYNPHIQTASKARHVFTQRSKMQRLNWLQCLQLISHMSNLKVIMQEYFSVSPFVFVAEVTDFPSWVFPHGDYLTCCWNHDGGRRL